MHLKGRLAGFELWIEVVGSQMSDVSLSQVIWQYML